MRSNADISANVWLVIAATIRSPTVLPNCANSRSKSPGTRIAVSIDNPAVRSELIYPINCCCASKAWRAACNKFSFTARASCFCVNTFCAILNCSTISALNPASLASISACVRDISWRLVTISCKRVSMTVSSSTFVLNCSAN
ncbi:MAG: hypothetical protein ACD_48C00505G0001 [uncultured bacterium]|nr:MAG: hypothetical protein ACD_48C00505G0001 [uncultured bacterium]